MAKLEKEKKEEEKKINKWIFLIKNFLRHFKGFCKMWKFFYHIKKQGFLFFLLKGLNCADIAKLANNINKCYICDWFSAFLRKLDLLLLRICPCKYLCSLVEQWICRWSTLKSTFWSYFFNIYLKIPFLIIKTHYSFIMQISHSIENVGKMIKGSKKKYSWEIELNGKKNILDLYYSIYSSKF